VADRIPLLSLLAPERYLGKDALGPARARAGASAEEPPAKRRPIVDSQSVKTTGVGGQERGYDGAKKVKGSLSVICS
jgi:hypothetical protein